VPAFPVIKQKVYLKCCIPQILTTSERGRRFNIAFYHKNFAKLMPKKNGIVNTSQEFFSSVKKPKDQNEIFRPTNLKQGQISDI